MRRSKHHFAHTMEETQGAFAQLVRSVGGGYNEAAERRVMALKIDETPISKINPEQRKPESNFYGQGFVEALSVARILVLLNLDEGVENIARREAPDVRIDFANRGPIFIEHSTVTPHAGMTFDRHLDDVNTAVRRLLQHIAQARAANDAAFICIRLSDPGLAGRSKPDAIAAEVAALLPTLHGTINLQSVSKTAFPTLGTYRASVFRRPGQPTNATICNKDAACMDPHPSWVAERLRAALSKKANDAARYESGAKPLWLLLTFEGEELYPPFVADLIEGALAGVSITPFERVIVWSAGCLPVVFAHGSDGAASTVPLSCDP